MKLLSLALWYLFSLNIGLPTVPVHIRFTATVIRYPVPSCRGSEVSQWWYGFRYSKLPMPYRIRYAAKPYLRAVYYVWWNWMFNLWDLNFMLAVTQSTASMAHHLKAPRVYGCYGKLCISCQSVQLYPSVLWPCMKVLQVAGCRMEWFNVSFHFLDLDASLPWDDKIDIFQS